MRRLVAKVLLAASGIVIINLLWLTIVFRWNLDNAPVRFPKHLNNTAFRAENTGPFTNITVATKATNVTSLISCGLIMAALRGPLDMNFTAMRENFDKLSTYYAGNVNKIPRDFSFEPASCFADYSLAVIVPFRGRENQLPVLLGHLHSILQRHLIRYQIFVLHQIGNFTFNKGRLMNTGFLWARNTRPFDCYIFHDVDLLPENDKTLYRCNNGSKVNHLSCSVDKFNYHPLCCGMTVGGVLAFSPEQFLRVNGYPNTFWGWGGEDDAMNNRIVSRQMSVRRPSNCRYTMIKHEKDDKTPYNSKLVQQRIQQSSMMWQQDGISNLNVNIVAVNSFPLYVNISVDVGQN